MFDIKSFHAHIYFNEETLDKAETLYFFAQNFGWNVGRFHKKPVGPHPDWSFQIAFEEKSFTEIVTWLMINRNGLNILVHPETEYPLDDHSKNSIWMGDVRPLDLSIFKKDKE